MNKIDAHVSNLIDLYQKTTIEFNQIYAYYNAYPENREEALTKLSKKRLELEAIIYEIRRLYSDDAVKGQLIIDYLKETGKNIFAEQNYLSHDENPVFNFFANLLQNSGCGWQNDASDLSKKIQDKQSHKLNKDANLTKKKFNQEIQKGLDDFKNNNACTPNSIGHQLQDKNVNKLFKQSDLNPIRVHLPISLAAFSNPIDNKEKSKESSTLDKALAKKRDKQNLRYPDHSSYHYIIVEFKKRGITIAEMAKEAMQDQLKHGVTAKQELYEKAIDTVIHKRDNMSLIMFGLAMDDLCTKKLLPQPTQYIMEHDLSSFSTDELVGVCLSMPYSGIAVTNFGARDVHKSGLAKKLDEDTKHCNVFADDIVSALIGDAEAIVAHKYKF